MRPPWELVEVFRRVPPDLREITAPAMIMVALDGAVLIRDRRGERLCKLHPEPWHRKHPAIAAEHGPDLTG